MDLYPSCHQDRHALVAVSRLSELFSMLGDPPDLIALLARDTVSHAARPCPSADSIEAVA